MNTTNWNDLQHKNSPEERKRLGLEAAAEYDGLQISCDLAMAGGKWYVVMRATGYEDDVYEFDDEETARKALAATLERAQAHKVDGLVEKIAIRRREKAL